MNSSWREPAADFVSTRKKKNQRNQHVNMHCAVFICVDGAASLHDSDSIKCRAKLFARCLCVSGLLLRDHEDRMCRLFYSVLSIAVAAAIDLLFLVYESELVNDLLLN